jgi:hypothetical protein
MSACRGVSLFLLLLCLFTLSARAVAGVSMLGCAWHGGGAAHGAMAGEGHLHHETAPHGGGHAPDSEATVHHSPCDGSCGECCVGMSGLPAAALPVAPPYSRVKPPVLADTPYVGHDPEGPERPPRHFVL